MPAECHPDPERPNAKRWHRSAIVLTTLFVVAYLLVALPGHQFRAGLIQENFSYWEHGWPFVCLTRVETQPLKKPEIERGDLLYAVGWRQREWRIRGWQRHFQVAIKAPILENQDTYKPERGLGWLDAESWQVFRKDHFSAWRIDLLLANAFVFAICTWLVFRVSSYLVSRKSRWYQVSMLDALLLTSVVCFSLIWFRPDWAASKDRQYAVDVLQGAGKPQGFWSSHQLAEHVTSDRLPVWLDRLSANQLAVCNFGEIGKDYGNYPLLRFSKLSLRGNEFPDVRELKRGLQNFTHIRELRITAASLAQLDAAASSWGESLRTLEVTDDEPISASSLRRFKNLRIAILTLESPLNNPLALAELNNLDTLIINEHVFPEFKDLPIQAEVIHLSIFDSQDFDMRGLSNLDNLVSFAVSFRSQRMKLNEQGFKEFDPTKKHRLQLTRKNFPIDKVFAELRYLDIHRIKLTGEFVDWLGRQPELRFVTYSNREVEKQQEFQRLKVLRPDVNLSYQWRVTD